MKLATRKKSAKKQKQSVKFNVQWLILILASFLMIAFVYYMVDAQRRQSEKKLKEMRKNLKVGDKVVTFSGISGVIDEVLEDRIILKAYPDDIKFSIEKWAIAGLDDRYIGEEGEVGDKDEVTKKD